MMQHENSIAYMVYLIKLLECSIVQKVFHLNSLFTKQNGLLKCVLC